MGIRKALLDMLDAELLAIDLLLCFAIRLHLLQLFQLSAVENASHVEHAERNSEIVVFLLFFFITLGLITG